MSVSKDITGPDYHLVRSRGTATLHSHGGQGGQLKAPALVQEAERQHTGWPWCHMAPKQKVSCIDSKVAGLHRQSVATIHSMVTRLGIYSTQGRFYFVAPHKLADMALSCSFSRSRRSVCMYLFTSIYLWLYLSFYLSNVFIYLFNYQCMYLSVSSISLSLCIYLSINVSIYVFMYLCIFVW